MLKSDESHTAFKEEKFVYLSVQRNEKSLLNNVRFLCQQRQSHNRDEVGEFVPFANFFIIFFFNFFFYRKGNKIKIMLPNTLVMKYIGLFIFFLTSVNE